MPPPLNPYFMYERKTYTKHYFCFVMVTDKVLHLYMTGDPKDGTVVGGQRRGKFGKFSDSGRVTGKLSTCINDDSCKTGSAYTGRMVNGRIARAAS